MLYVKINNRTAKVVDRKEAQTDNLSIQSRWDWKTFEQVSDIASMLNANEDGNTYIATDSGAHCSPQFDVVVAPKVGEEVSKGFNGDYYPCGYIKSISKTMKRIETTTGEAFYRHRQSGNWNNGTFSLIPGHIDERNPHF